MKITRTKNAKTNILFGMVFKIYQIVVPFVMRTLMIYQMGMDYAGLNNLFTSIFQILNLTELGIGAALTCSMYKPIAEDNRSEICALLKLYKRCFVVIGWIILLLGLLCIPFLGLLVKDSIPGNLNMTVLYLLYLFNTVVSYWLFSYKKSLLYAHQRNDVVSKVMLLTFTIQFALQVYVILFLKDYYLYLLASIGVQILQNIICAVLVDKMYPLYQAHGELGETVVAEIKQKVQGLVTNKIGGTILRSADSIVVSAFLGLPILAVYQNYFFILTAVIGIFSILFESCVAGIGNSLVVDSEEKNYTDFETITYIVGWLICISCSCFIALYQPFMELWVGNEYLLDFPLVICFVVYFFLYETDQLIGMYKDAAGIWYSDRFRPIVSALANLAMNIVLVQVIGLYGVLLSTVIALLVVDLPWLIHNVFVKLFHSRSAFSYVLKLVKLALYTAASSVFVRIVCMRIAYSGIIGLIVRFLLAVLISSGLLLMGEFRSDAFGRFKTVIISLIKR